MNSFRARALVSTDAIIRNLDQVRSVAGVDAMAVVKADAYGHGVSHIAPLLREHGVRWLGVALPSEALALRSAGDVGSILAWLSTPGDPDLAGCVAAGIDLSVSSVRELSEITQAAVNHESVANIHIKIDSGLSRNGILPGELDQLIPVLLPAIDSGLVQVRGVWSHLANADHSDSNFSAVSVKEQVVRYEHALATLALRGIKPEIRHLANTAGALWHPESRFDLVRIGIGMYGLSPNVMRATSAMLGVVPAMHIESRLSQIKVLPEGSGVSYSHTWIAQQPTRVGLVPIGYGDGIPRNLSNNLEFAIGGVPVSQIGMIAMDQCVVNLTGLDSVTAGDTVDIFGAGSSGELTADQLAQRMDTVGYEIVTRIGTRIPKEYT